MKIVTWNVHRGNRSIKSLFNYIAELEPDVICLQEVHEQHIDTIGDTFPNYKAMLARQFFLKSDCKRSIKLYNVTLSRLLVLEHAEVAHNWSGYSLPPRYRRNYSSLDLHFGQTDLVFGGADNYRVFNTHFECIAPPRLRLNRLQQVNSLFRTNSQNIIAGDFNTFLNPLYSFFTAPLYGNYTRGDFLTIERKAFTREFKRMNLVNHFSGQHTFVYFPGQYDYILAPPDLEILESSRLKYRHGSDHFGLMARFDTTSYSKRKKNRA